jgi:hypothetical protein
MRKLSISIACVTIAALGLTVSSASARHAPTHHFASTFPAPFGAPGGEFGVASIAVAEDGGYVYLENKVAGIPLEKYSADGTPTPFTDPEANSSTTLTTPGGGGFRGPMVEVDNSGNPATEGRIYVASESPGVEAFEASGKRVGGNFPIGNFARDVAIEPGTGNIWAVSVFINTSSFTQYTPDGTPTGAEFEINHAVTKLAMDTLGNIYMAEEFGFSVYKYNVASEHIEFFAGGADVSVDRHTNDVYIVRGEKIAQYGSGGSLLFEFGSPPESTNGALNVAVNGASERVYRLWGGNVDIYDPGATVVLPDVTTQPATGFQATSAVIHGTTNADGEPTTECYFEWGTSSSYGNKVDCSEGTVFTGSADNPVSAELAGLVKGTTYHYRLVVANGQGTIAGLDAIFTPSVRPTYSDEHVTNVHSDSVILHGAVNPEGAPTEYHFEIGKDDCSLGGCISTSVDGAPLGVAPQSKSIKVTGLSSGTTYHYRLVAENQSGPSEGADFTFTTFPITQLPPDPCPNSHVRQQTSAALLLDCRAYELTSTGNAGGYDVESDLVPGQSPFEGHPQAGDPPKVLYGVHEGAIPGVGNPANRGLDAYIATRGDDGWTTRYVGIPSDNQYAGGPFASSLLEADPQLDSFAFGGPDICNPCFADGSTNIPLRLRDGSLIEGIAGSQGSQGADPADGVAKYFSADGSHIVFATTTKLEPSGNGNGDTTVYSRNLNGGGTEVVSTLPDSSTMTGSGIGELDVSADGSRTVVAKRISTDAAGNVYWHPFMHIAGSAASVDLAPGSTLGVLYSGMTSDGSSVFFTSTEKLVGSDGDNSADLYEATVSQAGTASLTLLSTGATPPAGNTDSCDPVAAAGANNWNAVGPASTDGCGVVAIGGGGGVGTSDGSAYFLSPEALDGDGTPNAPNLFVARPGSAPAFVATLEPENPLVRDSVEESARHVYGDFQITPDGRYAAFASSERLTGFDSGGFLEVFRHDAQSDVTVCVSCNPTNARAVGSSTLPEDGLGLADDGAVFFDSADEIAPRDLDEKLDAYEYENGAIQLISTGVSPFDSRLLGVSADGVDAFFFTQDTLVQQDENGDLVKIYDARAGGGIPYVPPRSPCKASDECHGPGTEVPPAPDIRTIRGTGGNQTVPGGTAKPACKGHRVRRGKKCVKPGKHHAKRRHKSVHRHG